jgi:hypothetical protein
VTDLPLLVSGMGNRFDHSEPVANVDFTLRSTPSASTYPLGRALCRTFERFLRDNEL